MRLEHHYGYVRPSAGSLTVAQWRRGRFARCAPGLAVDIMAADGTRAHGRTTLATIRSGYGPDPEQDGRWPQRWTSKLEIQRMQRWANRNIKTRRYLICPRCDAGWLRPFDLHPAPMIPGTKDPATHHCTYCGWHGYRLETIDHTIASQEDLLRLFDGAETLNDVAVSISDSYTDEDLELRDLEVGVELVLGVRGLELEYPFAYQEFWDVIQYLEDVDMEEWLFDGSARPRFSSSS